VRDAGNADLVFVNGDVYTVDGARSWAGAVAVKDGEIVAVAPADDGVRDLIGSGTDVVDLRGAMLLPGFQDAHVHPVSAGVDMLLCDLHDLGTLDQYLGAIRDYADAHPDEPWILGGGWTMDAFPGGVPTRETLDAVLPDRPSFLPNRDGHSAWVNTKALEVAGITRETEDPSDGRIERVADGEPSGTLHEGAMELLAPHVPQPSHDLVHRGLLKGQEAMHAWGLTAWQDAIVDRDLLVRNYDAYLAAGEKGELTARVVGALWWDRYRELDQIDELVALRETGAAGRFAATSVKIMQDGVCENFTAAVLDPYLGKDGTTTENRGISFVDPELLNEAVTRLDALGFQVHFHALAERAVREALDAIEAARKVNGPADRRHHLAHIQVVHPDDLPRFRRLGAVANAQPLWAAHEAQMDELTIPFLGEPRWRWQYPFASLRRHGATIAMGSDWPVSTADPLEEIHVAVNRRMPADYPYRVETDEAFLPHERLDLASAIAGFTIGTAYVNHLERQAGSIEVGKYADLAVIDRNLFDHPADEISSARCLQTYVAGERVHAASDA
jgi:predicted amidohydrolase YtcJ